MGWRPPSLQQYHRTQMLFVLIIIGCFLGVHQGDRLQDLLSWDIPMFEGLSPDGGPSTSPLTSRTCGRSSSVILTSFWSPLSQFCVLTPGGSGLTPWKSTLVDLGRCRMWCGLRRLWREWWVFRRVRSRSSSSNITTAHSRRMRPTRTATVTRWDRLTRSRTPENEEIIWSEITPYIEGILPRGPYLPCVSMAGRALLAGYPRYINDLMQEHECRNRIIRLEEIP